MAAGRSCAVGVASLTPWAIDGAGHVRLLDQLTPKIQELTPRLTMWWRRAHARRLQRIPEWVR